MIGFRKNFPVVDFLDFLAISVEFLKSGLLSYEIRTGKSESFIGKFTHPNTKPHKTHKNKHATTKPNTNRQQQNNNNKHKTNTQQQQPLSKKAVQGGALFLWLRWLCE